MFATLKNKIDEKMPELSAKMKELGDKIVPPGQGEKEESPELLPLRALQQVPPMHSDGLPEKRLLVVLQPPEELPEAPAPAGTYSPVVVVGNMVHVSGIGPLAPEATSHVAKIGVSEDKEKGIIGTADGKAAARACALTMISVLRAQLGSLNHVKRLVNAKGFVNCTPDLHGAAGGHERVQRDDDRGVRRAGERVEVGGGRREPSQRVGGGDRGRLRAARQVVKIFGMS